MKTTKNTIPDGPYRLLIIGGSGSGKNMCIADFNRLILTKFICMQKIQANQSMKFDYKAQVCWNKAFQ